jgi:hypothetical protein
MEYVQFTQLAGQLKELQACPYLLTFSDFKAFQKCPRMILKRLWLIYADMELFIILPQAKNENLPASAKFPWFLPYLELYFMF